MRRLLSFLIAMAGITGTTQAAFLYVGEDILGGTGRIDRYDLSTGLASPATFAQTPFTVRGLVVDSAGDLFATDVTNNRIVEFTPGGVMSVFSTSNLLNAPHALAFDSAGNLFVANALGNNILKFTPNGVGTVFNSQSAGDTPIGLAFDSSGNLFVSDQATNKIVKITPGGVSSPFATMGVSGPAGIAFDSAGNLFVSAEGSNSIVKITPTGVTSPFASVPNISAGLAFDASGNLYNAVGGPTLMDPGQIVRFTPNAQQSNFATTLHTPIFLTISPSAVPEPASLVMLGIGVLGILVSAYRCKETQPNSPRRVGTAHRSV